MVNNSSENLNPGRGNIGSTSRSLLWFFLVSASALAMVQIQSSTSISFLTEGEDLLGAPRLSVTFTFPIEGKGQNSMNLGTSAALTVNTIVANVTAAAVPSSTVQQTLRGNRGVSKPIDNNQQKDQVPPSCRLSNLSGKRIDRIVFVHMRKAGGSSVRSYLKDVAIYHGVELKVFEGSKHPELPQQDNHTLYITHIREPLARAISHYKYEQRWGCLTQLKKPGFVPSENNTKMSLYTFIKKNHPTKKRIWTCASNCHARWVTGQWKHEFMESHPDELLKSAQSVFSQYNLVLVAEWLKDASYVKQLENLFGRPHLDQNKGMHCGSLSAKANTDIPLKIDNTTATLLKDRNEIDAKLYQDLTSCQYDFSDAAPLNWKGRFDRKSQQINDGRCDDMCTKKFRAHEWNSEICHSEKCAGCYQCLSYF